MTQVPPVRATRPDFGNPFESFCSPHLAIIALDNPGCGLKEADLIVKSGKRLGGGGGRPRRRAGGKALRVVVWWVAHPLGWGNAGGAGSEWEGFANCARLETFRGPLTARWEGRGRGVLPGRQNCVTGDPPSAWKELPLGWRPVQDMCCLMGPVSRRRRRWGGSPPQGAPRSGWYGRRAL